MKDVHEMIENARANDDEPVFVIRARDDASPETLKAYIQACKNLTIYDVNHVYEIRQILGEFETWRKAHPERCKRPD